MQGREWTPFKTARDQFYFGGCSSPCSQPVALSDLSGSGPAHSKHWNVRGPLPPGGSARIKKAPQPGQVGRSTWPMDNYGTGTHNCLFGPPDRNIAQMPAFHRASGAPQVLAELKATRI